MSRLNAICDSIEEIIERADECKMNQDSEFERGRLLAFNEVLSILKSDLTGEEDLEKLLSFDIDARYT